MKKSQEIRKLKARLTKLARSIRKSEIDGNIDFTKPESVEEDIYLFNSKRLRRKRIALFGRGCSVATCTMCPLPHEVVYNSIKCPSEEELILQFQSAFIKKSPDRFDLITIYTNGNFFVDKEIPPKVRQHIYSTVQKSEAKYLMVESLPQFITRNKLIEVKERMGEKHLIVSIGLESANDLVRELCINKTCTKPSFENAVNLLKVNGYSTDVFLMVKPPFLTEEESIEDTIKSIEYCAKLGILNPTLCPARIAPNTVLDMLYHTKKYYPLWLWTLLDIISNTRKYSTPRIAISNLRYEKHPNSLLASNCKICTKTLIDSIDLYNSSGSIAAFENITCDCYADYQQFLLREKRSVGSLPLENRVRQFLDELEE